MLSMHARLKIRCVDRHILRGYCNNAIPGSIRFCTKQQFDPLPSVRTLITLNMYLFEYSPCSVRFAKAARVDDFNSKDLHSPEKERTIVLLSAFINFVKFTEQYCDSFLKDLRERSDALIVQRDNVVGQLNEVQGKYGDLKYVPIAYCK